MINQHYFKNFNPIDNKALSNPKNPTGVAVRMYQVNGSLCDSFFTIKTAHWGEMNRSFFVVSLIAFAIYRINPFPCTLSHPGDIILHHQIQTDSRDKFSIVLGTMSPSQYNGLFCQAWDCHYKIRWSCGSFIFIIRTPILIRQHIYIVTVTRFHCIGSPFVNLYMPCW